MSGDGDLFVGIDLGTQSARVLVVGADATVAGRGAAPLRSRRDGDAHEQSPRGWWHAAAAACRDALAGVAAERVRALATCGTSGTIVLVDRDGEPVTEGLMYDDGRAAVQARRLGMATSWALPKLHWLLERERAATRPGVRAAHQPDVVTRRLVGHAVASDASHALKTGYDAQRACFADPGDADLRELLPDVVAPGTRLGEVCARAAAETGLPRGAAVIAGMTDGCAAQIAAGALRPGDCNSVLGTTLVLKGCAPQRIDDRARGVYSHRSPDGDWLPGGASSSGAGVLPATFPKHDLDELGRRAAEHERTSVLAYPLVSRGERFPFAAADARAFVLGTPAGDGEHAAALMQGVALVERLCFEQLAGLGAPVDGELSLTGGATRNRAWCQLRADALGRPARLPEQSESAFGMAILAAAATAGELLAGAARRMSRTRAVVEPRASLRAHLDEQYDRLLGELVRRGWLAGAADR
ncbi:MAG: carbohydrate kinase, FGGY() [uncultured Solirubrobacteraceae bacterium]|uniref:Carbohydrate kinase, FGGY( ) n=1 Tax=uncultured Solirubrobacteraceae bacterium TaxID=1162706 RepID=A0A6J4SQ47_9ACTN|nr:MAG: carbohydrate kinase, FGGY() [uncultured Solirubrobacteraceae bacterium]